MHLPGGVHRPIMMMGATDNLPRADAATESVYTTLTPRDVGVIARDSTILKVRRKSTRLSVARTTAERSDRSRCSGVGIGVRTSATVSSCCWHCAALSPPHRRW